MRQPCVRTAVIAAALSFGAALAQPVIDPAGLEEWPGAERAAAARVIAAAMARPNPEGLRALHDLMASEPHIAGTPGDQRTIERLVREFAAAGLEVERHDWWGYLCLPSAAALEIVEPDRRALILKENILADDPSAADPAQTPGWNAYSADGDVTARVVYANYATKPDFARLAELGVDVKGAIVLARYGGCFRGYKAKFAEEAGAAGLVIFTDPGDSGYMKGLVYPEGGYANDTCIERGSLNTLPYAGDPLTPGVEATKDAARLDPGAVALPKIPVQPVGYGAALEIMKRMTGAPVPAGWQGGLPLPYRVTGGDALKVRLMVKQERAVKPSANVIGLLRGTQSPEQMVIVGCHHDAWNCGAADPLCGQIAMIEAARALGALAKEGVRPRRTLVFCAWGGEEFGLMGSSEWVEANRARLTESAVSYMNLDMASMGPDFGSSASPSLRRAIAASLAWVAQARAPGKSAFEVWKSRAPDDVFADRPKFGDMGGGSDHVGFLCHAGVPVCSVHGGGSPGTSYHSTYDTLTWYRKVVGEDYEPALMVARAATAVSARLAYAPLVPLDPADYGPETRRQLVALTARGRELGVFSGQSTRDVAPELARVEGAAVEFSQHGREVMERVRAAVGAGSLTGDDLERVNDLLVMADRVWHAPEGLPDRRWFCNLYGAPDRDSGYASWMLPLLRAAVEEKDRRAVEAAEDRYIKVFAELTATVENLNALADSGPAQRAPGR